MQESHVWICILLFFIGGFLGGLTGYSIGEYQMRHEAIGNGSAEWKEVKAVNSNSNGLTVSYEFAWRNH